jgi:uncharacterized protein (DUF849 family)
MPIKVRKIRNQDCYRVFNAETGEIYAKCTTREKALAQKRLLEEADKKDEEEKIDDVVDKTKQTIKKKKPKSK